ncbi:MAG: glycosyltransferase family 2 protein [Cytophagaceae bacterium]
MNPENKQTSLSFIILAYYDAPALPGLIKKLHEVISSMNIPFEILIVDDGSKDDTYDTAKRLSESRHEIRVIKHTRNQGVGASFNTGLQAARYNFVGYMDGDAQYEPNDLGHMCEKLFSGQAHAVSGIRVQRADPFIRSVVSFFYNKIIHLIFGFKYHDINSGIKIYSKESLQKIMPVYSTGPFFDAEIFIKISAEGKVIQEVPVSHYERKHGKSRGISSYSLRSTIESIMDIRMKSFRKKNTVSTFTLKFLGLAKKLFL